MASLKIIIVEDDSLIALLLQAYIKELGHEFIMGCDSGSLACEKASALKPDLILMDIRLHGSMTGLEAARIIQKNSPTKILFVTANPHMVEPFIQDNWFHDCALISKPTSLDDLKNGILKLFPIGV